MIGEEGTRDTTCLIDVLYTCQDDDVPPMPPDATIIEACNNAPKTELGCVPITLMFSSELVIKHVRVTLEECRNKIKAYELLDPSIVVVPKVYRYFSHNDNIYLVMQRIHGQVRKRVEDLQSVRRIADIIRHLQTHKSDIPGPVGGGISRGLWWGNEDADLRGEVARFAEYIKRRLKDPQQGWTFDMGESVMNHNDIAPRNIIWMPDGSISLIDWAHAGFYPWLLELVILEFNTDGIEDLGFTIPLSEEFEPLSEADQKNKASLQMAWFNGHRYPVEPLDPLPPCPADCTWHCCARVPTGYDPPLSEDYSRALRGEALNEWLLQDLKNKGLVE